MSEISSVELSGRPKPARDAGHARRGRRAFLHVLPLLAFLSVFFLAPIGYLLWNAVDEPAIGNGLRETAAILRSWDGVSAPPDEAFDALAAELKAADAAGTIQQIAGRLNFEVSGMRRILRRTLTATRDGASAKESVLTADPVWSEPHVWAAIRDLGARPTTVNLLGALDLRKAPTGDIERVAEDYRINTQLFVRTLWIGLLVTGLCLLLGYPIAYLIATSSSRMSNFLLILVVIPLWTSLLVRTAAWMALLQRNGVINETLVGIGLLDDANRLALIFNTKATVIAMTHILLPFMVLPLYSVMRAIPPSYMRAAESLGASRTYAYWRVYVPQVTPGIMSGCLLVFIMSVGYYITPALIGGESGQMISNMIAYHVRESLNWGLASALGGILLVGVLALYFLYIAMFGSDKIRVGG